MRCVFALCLTLVCFVDKSYGTFGDFLNNLPAEVANGFKVAWGSITDAIKKPVKIKRLGPGGRTKTTTIATTPTINTVEVVTNAPKHTGTGDFVPTPAFIGNKVTLPLLSPPQFKSIDDWRNMQKALFAQRKKLAHPAPILIIEQGSNSKPYGRAKFDDDSFATQMIL